MALIKCKVYDPTKILLSASRAVVSSLDPEKVSELVLKESSGALDTEHASLFLIDERSGRLELNKAIGFSRDEVDNIKILGSWEVVNSQVVKKAMPLLVNDIHSSPIFKKRNLPFLRQKLPIHSFLAVPLKSGKKVIGVLIVSNRKRHGCLFSKKDESFLMGLSNHVAIALMNSQLYNRLRDLYINTVASLVKTIEAKDSYTGGHSERVMKYARAIGLEMGLEGEAIESVRLAGLLHDIGKVGVKDDILMKNGELSGPEKEQIYKHPSIGAKIVESIARSRQVIRGILEHHERFGGGGYPRGLKGRAISLEARIVAVADAYDALTTDRPYQKKFGNKDACNMILEGSGDRFDPKVIRAFKQSFKNHPEIWLV